MAGGAWLAMIPWDKVFEFAEKAFAKCLEDGATPEEQKLGLRNPAPRFRLKLERITERGCKKNGMTAKEWRRDRDKIMARVYSEAANASDSEIAALRQRAKDVDPSTIDDDEEV